MTRNMLRRSALRILTAVLMAPAVAFATHQRAAEMSFRHLSGLSYELTLISYTFTPSPANAYRDSLTINWGDGDYTEIPRTVETNLPDEITYNVYKGVHEFHGPGTFTISCEDPNRNGGIINIPNSINTPMYIYCELTISPFFTSYDNSPVLLVPPVDNGCVNQPFFHNPGAYDPDGDSLSYKLVPCRGTQGENIPGYSYPQASDSISLDPVTGDFIWNTPVQQGEYNIAILVEEWRNGRKIGSVVRDMQIIVVACNNHPPVIEPIADTCIEAGKNLRFVVKAYDPDSNNVTLSGAGGPLIIENNPATLEPNPATAFGHVQSVFKWSTTCGHVKKNPYQMFFKAKDDAKPVSLAFISSLDITVVGPAPKNLVATPLGNAITLNWDSYTCQNATGYQVWRKADSTGFQHGYCETGVPPYLGYSKIAEITDITKTSYLDDNNGSGLLRGLKYCYMIVAVYPDKAESYASNETCASLKKDVPVLTNVSINTTSDVTGSIYTAWSKPTEIDPVQAPGPYRYLIARSRSDAPGQFVLIDSLNSLDDTIRTENLMNTAGFGYRYRIDLYNITPGNRFLIGSSQPASSMYLSITPTDETLILSWTNDVPWTNERFTIYRKDPGSAVFDSVGSSEVNQYKDQGLVNGRTYCYKIKSTGKYTAPGYVEPIINWSQETCSVPIDNVPPCPPALSVISNCVESMNTLFWKNPVADSCDNDIAKYYIYYTPVKGEPVLVDSVMHSTDTSYIHRPGASIIGCYGIAAADSAGNISLMSNIVCVDITGHSECLYRLPNFFSPNGDEKNQYFRPFPYTGVNSVNIRIFDRWGREVFSTRDPDINWDGKDKTTGQSCSEGTYFYVCEVNETTLSGPVTRQLNGSLTLLR